MLNILPQSRYSASRFLFEYLNFQIASIAWCINNCKLQSILHSFEVIYLLRWWLNVCSNNKNKRFTILPVISSTRLSVLPHFNALLMLLLLLIIFRFPIRILFSCVDMNEFIISTQNFQFFSMSYNNDWEHWSVFVLLW